MTTVWTKLASRKLWLAVAGIATGLALALGVDAEAINTVAGAVTALVSVVTYIVVEGKVDAQRIKTAVEAVQEAANAMEQGED